MHPCGQGRCWAGVSALMPTKPQRQGGPPRSQLTWLAFPSPQMCRRVYKGIPLQVRGQVWSLLLDVEKMKKENEGKYEVGALPGKGRGAGRRGAALVGLHQLGQARPVVGTDISVSTRTGRT